MEYDVIVLGCGTMGVATALSAARKGASVLALDRASVPNDLGEHHGGARMFRTSYYEHADYVPLLKRSFALWHEIQRDARTDLFHVTGGLYLGRPDGEVVPGSLRAAREHGLEHEVLDADGVRRRWPQFRVPEGMTGLFERAAGVLRPEACVRSMAALARDAGATIGTFEEVTDVDLRAGGVRVTTARSRYEGASVVVAGGPWSSRLLAGVRGTDPAALPRLIVTRQPLAWLAPRDAPAFAPDRFPAWAVEDAPGSLLYGFPVLPDDSDMRIARHRRGEEVEPDAVDRVCGDGDLAGFVPQVRGMLPGAGGVTRSAVCMYTNSADGHFVIDRVPGAEQAFVACGFSGHGFKFAPVVGEIMASLALEGGTEHPIEFLGMSRFQRARGTPGKAEA